MRNRFDQLARRLGRGALEPFGRTIVQHEISPDAQYADIFHVPDPAQSKERARLGLLGRLSAQPCLIEVFGHTPTAEEVKSCIGKYLVAGNVRSDHRGKARQRRKKGHDTVPAFLWIITTGRPEAVLSDVKAGSPDWPQGVYLLHDFLGVGIVVASELPRERDTLLVRLMAAGPLLAHAIEDLSSLPKNAHEHAVASQILLDLRHVLETAKNRSQEEQEIFVSTQNLVEKLWNEGRQEGRVEGRQEGRVEGGIVVARKALRRVLSVRGLAPTLAQSAQIDACVDLDTLDRWLDQALVAGEMQEALRDAPHGKGEPQHRPPPRARKAAARSQTKVPGAG